MCEVEESATSGGKAKTSVNSAFAGERCANMITSRCSRKKTKSTRGVDAKTTLQARYLEKGWGDDFRM